jgi:hypothetical protein
MKRRLVVGATELRGREIHSIDQWKPSVAAEVFEQVG